MSRQIATSVLRCLQRRQRRYFGQIRELNRSHLYPNTMGPYHIIWDEKEPEKSSMHNISWATGDHGYDVTVAMLLAMLTGRSDLCIAGVFGAGKTISLAVLLVLRAPHLSCSSFHKGKRCRQGLERPNCGT